MFIKNEFVKIILLGILFAATDSIYLKSVSGHFNNLLMKIQGSPISLKPVETVLAYVALVFSLYYFIIREKRSVFEAGLLGWSIYAVYEFTNAAIFNKWGWTTVIIDTLWGGVLYMIVTALYYRFII
jgi:uncharacterized membrane protein